MKGIDLKYFRIKKGISQQDLANILGVTTRSIVNYEKSDEVPLKKIQLLKDHYKSSFDIKRDKDLIYTENTNGNKFWELPNGKFRIQVEKVPFKAYASFIEVYNDEYTGEDKQFTHTYFTVDKVGRGKYVAFTVGNDSMNGNGINDTPSGAEVLGREIGKHLWTNNFRTTQYGFIVVAFNGIYHKDITLNPKNTNEIICKSRNTSPEFQTFNLPLKEIHSIYNVIKRTF